MRGQPTAQHSSPLSSPLEPEVASARTGPLDTTLLVETPEHVALRYQLAGPARRAVAYSLDLLLRVLILMLVSWIVVLTSIASGFDWFGFESGALLLVFFLLEWGYFVFFETIWGGSSPGKRALRLRTIHQDGRNLSLRESVLRNLLRAADLLPFLYAIGVVVMSLDPHFRRLGDLAAGTVVVSEARHQLEQRTVSAPKEDIPELPPRPRLSAQEKAALGLFCRRLPQLSQARAEELADIVAPVFRQRFHVPDAPSVLLLQILHIRSGRS